MNQIRKERPGTKMELLQHFCEDKNWWKYREKAGYFSENSGFITCRCWWKLLCKLKVSAFHLYELSYLHSNVNVFFKLMLHLSSLILSFTSSFIILKDYNYKTIRSSFICSHTGLNHSFWTIFSIHNQHVSTIPTISCNKHIWINYISNYYY